ncbi:hypothetical protein CC1G_12820 [Coprinopsis cinerea okayama7|uniref:Uncharacterized protein n=1 Tax=Coprinopsis cinerea (strain Okayama-7 / 130 / ATCC MYA-4618 / FGSC 9003) TaxID=240176 RepID=A8PD74_COPC7|nr:hypothetical protein CC1G_12820 [Coprinopsis cinerea okayama7\|eukprot:XP_001840547.2 hypothetical protein CC1G_12820 [Coprinopsis cinerea okayama7\
MPKAASDATTRTPSSLSLLFAPHRTPTSALEGPTYDGSDRGTFPCTRLSSDCRSRKTRGFKLHISIDASKRRSHSKPKASGTSRPAISPLRIVQSGTSPIVEKPKTPAHRPPQLHAASSYSFTCGVPTPDSEVGFSSQVIARTGCTPAHIHSSSCEDSVEHRVQTALHRLEVLTSRYRNSVSELESDIALLRDEIASIDESFRKEKELVDALPDEEFAKQYGLGVTRQEWLFTAGGHGQGGFFNF